MARSPARKKKSPSRPRNQPQEPRRRRWPWVLLAIAAFAVAGTFFVTVQTAAVSTGAVEAGDVVVFESATAATLNPHRGQVLDVKRHGVGEVLAVDGDEVAWKRQLLVNGEPARLTRPIKREQRAGRVSPLMRGAARGVGASRRRPAALDIPRSPYVIPRHHLLIGRTRGETTTTHLVPYADIRATGRLVIASKEDGDRPLPRLLP